MKRFMTALFASIFTIIIFTGCGDKEPQNGYRFYQEEISNIIGMSKSELDSLDVQPDSVTPGDIYAYNIPHSTSPEKKDAIMISVLNGRVIGAFITNNPVDGAADKSEHTICGIRYGDSRAAAESAGEAYSGSKGVVDDTLSQLMPGMDSLTNLIETVSYGSEDTNKGKLSIVYNKMNDTVLVVALTTH